MLILQEAEAKLDADAVLRDVLRKKSDAKKCITKLDGLLDLRRARMNTAKGRGETVNENEMTAFKNNIGKNPFYLDLRFIMSHIHTRKRNIKLK